MPRSKPAPPKQSVLDAEAVAAAKKLGVKLSLRSKEDITFDFLVAYWRKHGRTPTRPLMDAKIGTKSGGSYHVLTRLVKAGRVLHPRTGVYVPKV